MQNIDIRLYIRYSSFKENIFITTTNKKLQKYYFLRCILCVNYQRLTEISQTESRQITASFTFLHSTILSELRNWSFDTPVLCEPARAERVGDIFPPFDKKGKTRLTIR